MQFAKSHTTRHNSHLYLFGAHFGVVVIVCLCTVSVVPPSRCCLLLPDLFYHPFSVACWCRKLKLSSSFYGNLLLASSLHRWKKLLNRKWRETRGRTSTTKIWRRIISLHSDRVLFWRSYSSPVCVFECHVTVSKSFNVSSLHSVCMCAVCMFTVYSSRWAHFACDAQIIVEQTYIHSRAEVVGMESLVSNAILR